MGNLTDFYLLGHSFGGYILGNYILKYHQHVKKLMLLSPVGLRVTPEGENDWQYLMKKIKEAERESGVKPPPAYIKAGLKMAWNMKISPF